MAGKRWLEPSHFKKVKQRTKKPPQPVNSVPPTERNFSENLEPLTTEPAIKPNSPPLIKVRKKPVIVNPKSTKENFPPLTIKKESKIPENNEQLPVISEKEQILLEKIKQLREQLAQVQSENKQLKIDKEKAEALVQQEKERVDNYKKQLKIIAKGLYQWAKINHYKKLEQEQDVNKEQQANIEQPLKSLP